MIIDFLDWLRQFFKPYAVTQTKRGGWRCTYCKLERHYEYTGASARLLPECNLRRTAKVNGQDMHVACPLAPMDPEGNELTYEEWKRAR